MTTICQNPVTTTPRYPSGKMNVKIAIFVLLSTLYGLSRSLLGMELPPPQGTTQRVISLLVAGKDKAEHAFERFFTSIADSGPWTRFCAGLQDYATQVVKKSDDIYYEPIYTPIDTLNDRVLGKLDEPDIAQPLDATLIQGGMCIVEQGDLEAFFQEYGLDIQDEWYGASEDLEACRTVLGHIRKRIKAIFQVTKTTITSQKIIWDTNGLLSTQLEKLKLKSAGKVHTSALFQRKQIAIIPQDQKYEIDVDSNIDTIIDGISTVIDKYFDAHFLHMRREADDQDILGEPYTPITLQKLRNGQIRITGFPGALQDKLFQLEPEEEEPQVTKKMAFLRGLFAFLLLSADYINFAQRINQPTRNQLVPARGGNQAEIAQAFATLGLPTTATIDLVKQTFRAFARQYHPDKCTDCGDTMQKINGAYQLLRSKINKT